MALWRLPNGSTFSDELAHEQDLWMASLHRFHVAVWSLRIRALDVLLLAACLEPYFVSAKIEIPIWHVWLDGDSLSTLAQTAKNRVFLTKLVRPYF